ncbi:MAG: S41 family peptidase [Zavarzinella sp.]
MKLSALIVSCSLIFCTTSVEAATPIILPNNPALSPDGKTLAFDWAGSIWVAPSSGGTAKRLTFSNDADTTPKFSPDGKTIAFTSRRATGTQIFTIPATGGPVTQKTFDTNGFQLCDWLPDGKGWLVTTVRDNGWSRRNGQRLQKVFDWQEMSKRLADEMIFDDYGAEGALNQAGNKLLFTREGPSWWRKGYTGSQSSQVWQYDLATKQFEQLKLGDWDARFPMFGNDGTIYYCSGQGGCFNLWERTAAGKMTQLTKFADDSVVMPAISRDGSTIVFRNLVDLYVMLPGKSEKPQKISLSHDEDFSARDELKQVLSSATQVAFTSDGLEIAFLAGGDVWVMDTELKEPRQVTNTPEEERSILFSDDGKFLFFVSDRGGKTEIWKAERKSAKEPWFLNQEFPQVAITNDGEDKTNLQLRPKTNELSFVRTRGDLYLCDFDGKKQRCILESWNDPSYDWSPDGKWLVYAISDSDFNSDIWIHEVDGDKKVNISSHPFNEYSPVWSPDGKMIAFTGQRDTKDNVDIFYVWLKKADADQSERDLALEKALKKFPSQGKPKEEQPKEKKDEPDAPKKNDNLVEIDFDGLHDRLQRITIQNSSEGGLFWSPDSKRLAFNATVSDVRGIYTVEFPSSLKPKLLTSTPISGQRWLKNGLLTYLSAGKPGSLRERGGVTPTTTTYSFSCYHKTDLAKKHQAAFDMAWKRMRDNWYDGNLGNRKWDAVREKYRPFAATPYPETLSTVVSMMLGELNGSHLGFTYTGGRGSGRGGRGASEESSATWDETTAHLGVIFDPTYAGPGWKVKTVIPNTTAAETKSQLFVGDVILEIDGNKIDPKLNHTIYLNVPPKHEFTLEILGKDEKRRTVKIFGNSPSSVRFQLYPHWISETRKKVEELSKGTCGYLHIQAMNFSSFSQFQEDLYHAGAGKDGLVIDVRENGGGSTADLLLTALTQPRHAYTIPRGGNTPGYPQDRTVFATWHKPIVVLCNQNSFSNAEIFSHAIKTLKRGKVVGVPTAGGVISTGGTTIMDVGFLRMPFRGWYLIESGEDMELHGAVPDVIVWPQPGDMTTGKDRQVEAAVKELLADVKEWKSHPLPKPIKATSRPDFPAKK